MVLYLWHQEHLGNPVDRPRNANAAPECVDMATLRDRSSYADRNRRTRRRRAKGMRRGYALSAFLSINKGGGKRSLVGATRSMKRKARFLAILCALMGVMVVKGPCSVDVKARVGSTLCI
jgi:CO/xanthine dehydrogenase Mo-binding subunit